MSTMDNSTWRNFSDLEQNLYLLAGGHDNLVLLPVEVVRVLVRVVGRHDLSRGGHGGRLDRLPGGGEALVHHAAVAVENNYSVPLLFNIILISPPPSSLASDLWNTTVILFPVLFNTAGLVVPQAFTSWLLSVFNTWL